MFSSSRLWQHLLIASLLCSPLWPVASAQLQNPVIPELTIPWLNQPPVIDGNIEESEWAQCHRSIGLMQSAKAMASREAVFWIGSDRQYLYVAMQSELPDTGDILSRVKPAGTADRTVHRDDCIELWIAPGRPQNASTSYFQIAVNPNGALFDVKIDPGHAQLPNQPGWRVNGTFANRIDNGFWQAEIAIPLAELQANPDDSQAHPWKVRIGRNWQQPPEQTEWAPRLGGFADLATMTTLHWRQDAPLVRMLSLRDDEGKVDLQLEISNPTRQDTTVRVELFHRTADNPHNVINQLYTLPAGTRELVRVRDPLALGLAETVINITSPDATTCYFRRAFQWQVERDPKRWTAAADGAGALALDIAYYPSANRLKARLDFAGLRHADTITGATLQLRQPGGTTLHTRPFPPFHDKRSELIIDLPPLAAGEYEVSTLLQGNQAPAEPVVQRFVRRTFPWENNTLGYHDGVIPPFEPLQINGNTLQTVLRQHQFAPTGLWQQVRAQEHELLQAPVTFDIQVDGQACTTVISETLRFTEHKQHQAAWQAAWQAGPLKARLHGTCEMDGMMKFVLDLEQQGQATVERCDLVIPLQPAIATLLHASGPGLRANYAGRVPAGEGPVWNSSMTGSHLIGQFIPYLWVGSEGPGIAWFAESDRDWLYDDNKPTHTLVRTDAALELRVHFVNKPAPLGRPRRLVFALQATPTKPMPGEPRSWRNWISRTSDEGKDPATWRFAASQEQQHWRNWVSRTNQRYTPRAFTHFMLAGSSSWGTDSGHAFIYPVNRDFMVYDLLQETRRRGERNLDRENEWFTRYDQNLPEAELRSRHDHIRWATRNLAGQPDAVVPYTDPRASVFNPEFETYQDEWLISAYSSRNWDFKNPRAAVAYRVSPGKSFQDYHLWYIRHMLQTFADAIYFDNTYLLATDDIMLGAYYADDGSLRPAVDIFAMREHLKRVQTLTWQLGKNWLASMSHMTNAQIVPINTWCGTNLDWEWKYSGENFQNRFSRELIRTTSIGLQTGSVPFVLGTTGIRGQLSPERKAFLMRSLLGTSLVHEIKNLSCEGILGDIYARLATFGYGTPECRVLRYWEPDFPVAIRGVEAEALLLVKEKEALILVTSFGPAGTAEVSLPAETLKLPANGRFFNAESETELPADTRNATCRFELPEHDFILLHYK